MLDNKSNQEIKTAKILIARVAIKKNELWSLPVFQYTALSLKT